eukprot:767771-Hanusia_phi.AAC.6
MANSTSTITSPSPPVSHLLSHVTSPIPSPTTSPVPIPSSVPSAATAIHLAFHPVLRLQCDLTERRHADVSRSSRRDLGRLGRGRAAADERESVLLVVADDEPPPVACLLVSRAAGCSSTSPRLYASVLSVTSPLTITFSVRIPSSSVAMHICEGMRGEARQVRVPSCKDLRTSHGPPSSSSTSPSTESSASSPPLLAPPAHHISRQVSHTHKQLHPLPLVYVTPETPRHL